MYPTIQTVIDALPHENLPNDTVDGLLCGDAGGEARGVAVTFLMTQGVLEQAASIGANLVISHEGIYYSHRERPDWLSGDAVYEQKRRLLAQSGVAVYRCHDGIHRSHPDGITEGLLAALGWRQYEVRATPVASVVELPETGMEQVVSHIKRSLGISHVRLAGDAGARCRRVGVFVGYRGAGEQVLPLVHDMNMDLVICGEGPEWEAPEYFRDAARQGRGMALLALGHAESEMPGMRLLTGRLQERFPALPVRFLADEPVFRTV